MLHASAEFPSPAEQDPTLYIIGGLPRTGKTTVGGHLARDLGISNLETDHIRVLFKPTLSSKLRPSPTTPIDVVTRKLRPRLECLIESLVENRTDMVINGECIDPHMIAESPYRGNIRSCFMGLDDPEATFDRIRRVGDPRDWAMEKTDEELKRILEKYAARSLALGSLCVSLEIPYIDASQDFLQAHEDTYAILSNKKIGQTALSSHRAVRH